MPSRPRHNPERQTLSATPRDRRSNSAPDSCSSSSTLDGTRSSCRSGASREPDPGTAPAPSPQRDHLYPQLHRATSSRSARSPLARQASPRSPHEFRDAAAGGPPCSRTRAPASVSKGYPSDARERGRLPAIGARWIPSARERRPTSCGAWSFTSLESQNAPLSSRARTREHTRLTPTHTTSTRPLSCAVGGRSGSMTPEGRTRCRPSGASLR
jgi:hypothetical protein